MSSRANNKVSRGDPIELVIDGQTVSAFAGETIAAVLLLQDKTSCYRTRGDRPRMMFCNMGVCFECRVRVTQNADSRWVLACVTPAQANMRIDTNVDLSHWIAGTEPTIDHDVNPSTASTKGGENNDV
ncbi:(2Fe-2S)-binding protein [Arenicella xantha]|nr:(2Fe-2S)-binding protein [Arenicella xantha]